ncbi:MAG: serine hydrolase [Acidobacteria bacterium]|nr:serine hydrolase [Acidobacteriota bacterium]
MTRIEFRKTCALWIAFCLLAATAFAAPAETVQGDLGKKLDDYLTRLEQFGWSGSALVAKDGQILLSKGYGFANRAKKIPFTADTVSNIGSIVKQFTGAAIMKLEMQGKLNTNDPIGKYLPNVPPDKSEITIHHLLTHSAGFRGDFGGRDDEAIGRDDLVKKVLAAPLKSKPGEHFEYSNEGFSLAAAIVEIVSGKTYEQFLYENLFKPAGMEKTGYVRPDWSREVQARGYTQDGNDWGTVPEKNWRTDGPGWYLKGNGGIQSTAEDMYKWHLALLGEKILSKEAKEKYFGSHVKDRMGPNSSYGYGWGIETTPRNTKLITHNGGNGVFFADFRRYVDEGIVIYVMGNTPVIRATSLGAEILPALIFGGREVPTPPAVIALDSAALQRLAGEYRLPSGEKIVVTPRDGRLKLRGDGPESSALLSSMSPPGGPFAEVERHSTNIVEAASRGDFETVYKEMGGGIPLERIREQESPMWQRFRDDNGEFKGVKVLGTARNGPGPTVYLQMNFERDNVILMHQWGGGQIRGIQLLRQLPESEFLPSAPLEIVSFSLARPQATRIRFDAAADGSIRSLTIPTEGGSITAVVAQQSAAQGAPMQSQTAPRRTPSAEIPNTPAGKRMAAWLPVINRGDKTEIAKFVRENFARRALDQTSAEERTQVHVDYFAETGGVKVHSLRKSEPYEVEILAQAVKGGAWLRVGLRVEQQEPFGIMGFLFDEGAAPVERAPVVSKGRLSDADVAKEIETFLDQEAARDRFSGTVLLAKDGKPFLAKAWGKANIRYDVPNRVDTKFNLGSMNKMFTSVAIAQLVEQGKLSFQDTIGKILPDYPNKDVREKVTIHHLLTHTSGLGSYFSSKKYGANWTKIRTVDAFLDTFSDEPLEFEPGDHFSYSNSGFVVLGKIIEKVSGMSYFDYVREKIFQPAGMLNTDSYEMDAEVPNLAYGYTNLNPSTDRPGSGLRHSNLFQHSVKGGPAGGGFSTVEDLLRFHTALRSGKLLPMKMAETILTGKVAMGGGPSGMKYAYGFGEEHTNGQRIVGHNGGAAGISAWLDMFWDSGYTIAVLSNYDRGSFEVERRAKELLTRP